MYGLLKNCSRLWIDGSAIMRLKHSSVLKRYCTTALLQPDIEYAELQKKLDGNEVILIDVRPLGELIKDGRNPYAKHVFINTLGDSFMLPPEEFETQHGFKKPELDAPIVLTCLKGLRARTAQWAMKGFGYNNIRCYRGSIEDWVEKGGIVEYTEDK